MTQRRQLEHRLAGMAEIGEIMHSMKNLAFMETRKLARLLPNPQALVRQTEAVAADLLAFRPDLLPAAAPAHRVFLLLGSRRGFCGDFNERLIERWRVEQADRQPHSSAVIAVGHKLVARLHAATAVVGLDGADVAEEVPAALAAIVAELTAQQQRHPVLTLTVLWHRGRGPAATVRDLLPPFAAPRPSTATPAFAPELNLPAEDFLLGLVEQYLFASLHAMLYESLLAENERRVRHLDGAVRHLEERSATVQRRVRALRQEEIIEEIEVILLNAAGPEQRRHGGDEPPG
jgi:F-type H+-transporting ATPase subunit gamma